MNIGGVVGGLVISLIGFVLISVFAPVVLDNFATSGANANIGSFSGASSFNDMFPLFYFITGLVLVLGGLGIAGSQAGAGSAIRSFRRRR